MSTIIEVIAYNGWTLTLFVLVPWTMGVARVVSILVEAYRRWIWEGMDEEKRYFFIKVARW